MQSGVLAGGPGRTARDTRELRAVLFTFFLAAVIGVLGGTAAIGFQKLTTLARMQFMGGGAEEGLLGVARTLEPWQALLTPAIGAAVASLLLHLVFRTKGSYGIADLMELVSLRKGGVRAADTAA